MDVPSHHPFSIVVEVLANATRQERETKDTQIWKEYIKQSFCTDDMIFYVENSQDSTKNILELVSDYSKVIGYKDNI